VKGNSLRLADRIAKRVTLYVSAIGLFLAFIYQLYTARSILPSALLAISGFSAWWLAVYKPGIINPKTLPHLSVSVTVMCVLFFASEIATRLVTGLEDTVGVLQQLVANEPGTTRSGANETLGHGLTYPRLTVHGILYMLAALSWGNTMVVSIFQQKKASSDSPTHPTATHRN
jgi:hypothetical protein